MRKKTNILKKIFPIHLYIPHGPWFYLCHSLILLLIIYPYLEVSESTKPTPLLLLFNACLIFTIIYAASSNSAQIVLALALILPSLLASWFPLLTYAGEIIILSNLLLYMYAIMITVPHLLKSQTIGIQEIFGAISIYILIGLTWTALYQTIELYTPGSFSISNELNIENILTWSDFIFYSFTTLTTLGYGDIVPISHQARSLAILEAITGVLFLAIFISSAIGVFISEKTEKKN